MPDTDVDLSHLPIPTHDHGRRFETVILCSILAKTNRATPHYRVAYCAGNQQFAAECHSYITRPHPGPRQHLVHLFRIKASPFGEGLKGLGILFKEPLERNSHIIGQIGDIGPPRNCEARKISAVIPENVFV